MKQLICLLFVFTATKPVVCQQARDSVMAAINNLFTGMKGADTVLLKNCFSQNAVMQTIQGYKGDATVKTESVKDFIAFVGQQKAGAADEQIVIEKILMDGPMALVWTPYKFYFNGRFSHCGVNSFQLVRLSSGWKIQYIIDTRHTQGCE